MFPKSAFGLSQRFQTVYTPKKASRLNMAEIELSTLSKQCLDRRIGDIETFSKEVYAWAWQRDHRKATISWQFTPYLLPPTDPDAGSGGGSVLRNNPLPTG